MRLRLRSDTEFHTKYRYNQGREKATDLPVGGLAMKIYARLLAPCPRATLEYQHMSNTHALTYSLYSCCCNVSRPAVMTGRLRAEWPATQMHSTPTLHTSLKQQQRSVVVRAKICLTAQPAGCHQTGQVLALSRISVRPGLPEADEEFRYTVGRRGRETRSKSYIATAKSHPEKSVMWVRCGEVASPGLHGGRTPCIEAGRPRYSAMGAGHRQRHQQRKRSRTHNTQHTAGLVPCHLRRLVGETVGSRQRN